MSKTMDSVTGETINHLSSDGDAVDQNMTPAESSGEVDQAYDSLDESRDANPLQDSSGDVDQEQTSLTVTDIVDQTQNSAENNGDFDHTSPSAVDKEDVADQDQDPVKGREDIDHNNSPVKINEEMEETRDQTSLMDSKDTDNNCVSTNVIVDTDHNHTPVTETSDAVDDNHIPIKSNGYAVNDNHTPETSNGGVDKKYTSLKSNGEVVDHTYTPQSPVRSTHQPFKDRPKHTNHFKAGCGILFLIGLVVMAVVMVMYILPQNAAQAVGSSSRAPDQPAVTTSKPQITLMLTVENNLTADSDTHFTQTFTIKTTGKPVIDILDMAAKHNAIFKYNATYYGKQGAYITAVNGLASSTVEETYWAFMRRTAERDCMYSVGVSTYVPYDEEHVVLSYASYAANSTRVPNCDGSSHDGIMTTQSP